MRVWSWQNATAIRTLSTSHHGFGVAWHGDVLAAGSSDGKVFVWSSADWSLQQVLTPPASSVNWLDVCWRPDGGVLASGSYAGGVMVWSSGEMMMELPEGMAASRVVVKLT